MQKWFDQKVFRDGSTSMKWGRYNDATIPAWVADMDFLLAPSLQQHLIDHIQSVPLGYCDPNPNLQRITQRYLKESYHWQTQTQWQMWMIGMVPSLKAACIAFCSAGESVLVPQPSYKPFRDAVVQSDLELIEVPIVPSNGRVVMTAESIEKYAKANTTLLLFCNPHNPGGSVYTEGELNDILATCKRLNIHLISDEIHCEMLLNEKAKHYTMATLTHGDMVKATFRSPSKTYNLAGLGCSVSIIPNEQDRRNWEQATQGIHPAPGVVSQKAVEFTWGGQCKGLL